MQTNKILVYTRRKKKQIKLFVEWSLVIMNISDMN